MRGISWLAADQLASQEGLCTMEWVSKEVNMDSKVINCIFMLHFSKTKHVTEAVIRLSALFNSLYQNSLWDFVLR